ncbi:histidine kinase [Paracrocinitomix mangrovi]|uniref:sensor histidine kinase n=1 Tax=Paracrocinitomix mangrovi TaxID=2862509 RepID=UPI001C8E5BF2|nr:histidine kinase [Paracrocinitomix mangrovi]UKN01164.1 histidine kinase [Paracrocinitomix mangrovi]
MKHLLSYLLLTILSHFTFGQFEPTYRQLSVADGLPSNTIYDVTQGVNGEILIGHQYGVSRYNGIKVNEFLTNEQTPSLSNITLVFGDMYLCRSFNDQIYLINDNRLLLWDTQSSKARGYSTFMRFNDWIYQLKGNKILKIWDGNKQIEDNVLELDSIRTLYAIAEHQGLLCLSTQDSVIWINPVNNNVEGTLEVGSERHIFLYNRDENLMIFKSLDNKLHFVDQSGLSQPIILEGFNVNHKVNFIKETKGGLTAIGTFAGLYLYDQNFNLIGHYYQDMQISCMMEDAENNIWLGTLQDGILIIPSLQIYSLYTKQLFNDKTTISKIETIDDSLIAIGTFQGKLAIVDLKGELQHMFDFERRDEVQSIYVNKEKNELLVFCKTLISIDLSNWKIKHEQEVFPVKSSYVIDDTVFCGTSAGLSVFLNDIQIYTGEKEMWIRNIISFEKGLLLDAPSGIAYFNPTNLKVEDHPILSSIKEYTDPTNFLQIGDTLFFSSKGSVLYVYLQNIKPLFETASPKIRSLTYLNGQIYAADNKTIYAQDGSIINSSKGLMLNEIKGMSVIDNSLLVYNTEKFQLFRAFKTANHLSPQLSIKSIKGSYDDKMVTSFYDNSLQIEYEILPNISAQGNAKIIYHLSGKIEESDTLTAAEVNEVSFERLPYGDYNLSLTAQNEDGKTSDPYELHLTVNRPYYASWWFRIGLVLLVVVISIVVIRLRIKVLQKKNKEKLEKERLKTHLLLSELKAIRSQMDPHFIFNCLSAIQSNILSDEKEDAYQNLTVFTQLLREALLYTSREFNSLEEETSFIKKYIQLEQMRYQHPFDFSMEIDPKIKMAVVKLPSLITQPFVENAIRHGLMHKEGERTLKYAVAQQNNGDIIIQIIDNGVGLEKAKAINAEMRKNHQSTGIKSIYERIELLGKRGFNYHLDMTSDKLGTTVTFTIKKND